MKLFNKKKNKLLITILISFIINNTCITNISAATKWPSIPQTITVPSIIVMEASTGCVLIGKNIDKKLYPASITKVLTTLVALEHSPQDLNNTVTISKKSIDINSEQGGQYLPRIHANSKLSMNSALHAVMLRSANEVAYSVGETIAGTNEKFCKMLNEKASELGCKTTHFTNPSGLFSKDHYTSVYDMALISSAAIRNDSFKEIIKNKSYVIPETKCSVISNHKLVDNYLTDWCIGGKTGYTTSSKHSLVTFAKKDDMTLVCVVMNSPSTQEAADDTKKAVEYCFKNFQSVNIQKNENLDTIQNIEQISPFIDKFKLEDTKDTSPSIHIDKNIYLALPKDISYSDIKKEINFKDDVKLNEGTNTIGSISYYFDDKNIANCDIYMDYLPSNNLAPLILPSELDAPSSISNSHTKAPKKSNFLTNIHDYVIILAITLIILCSIVFIKYKFFSNRKRNMYYFNQRRGNP